MTGSRTANPTLRPAAISQPGWLAGLLGRATPLKARYVLRLITRNLRPGIGTPTILDAVAGVCTGGKRDRPVPLWRLAGLCQCGNDDRVKFLLVSRPPCKGVHVVGPARA